MLPYKSIALPFMYLLNQIDLFYLEREVFLMSATFSSKWTFLCLMHHPPKQKCQQSPSSRIVMIYDDAVNEGNEPSSVSGISSAYNAGREKSILHFVRQVNLIGVNNDGMPPGL